jgi:hypothetical protein
LMCTCIIFFRIGFMPVAVGRSSPMMSSFRLTFQFSESTFTSVHVLSTRHCTRIAFPVVSMYYRFHRIHSRTLSPYKRYRIQVYHVPNTAMAMEATGVGRIAGQLRCHGNEYNHRPEIADSDRESAWGRVLMVVRLLYCERVKDVHHLL